MRIDWKLIATLVCSFSIFLLLSALFQPHCTDCIRTLGWPFRYYIEGNFAGGSHFLWNGVLRDALLVLTAGTILWMAWNAATRSREPFDPVLRRRTWGWVRLAYGLVLFLDVLGAVLRQSGGQMDPRFAPANQGQLSGMVIGYAVFFGIALWLMLRGVREVVANRPEPVDNTAPKA